MARRYQIDELLWLRSSPLVTKPSGLPPIEEWMYVSSMTSRTPTTRLIQGISPTGLNPTQPASANNRLLVTQTTHPKPLQTEDLAFSKLAISHEAPIQV